MEWRMDSIWNSVAFLCGMAARLRTEIAGLFIIWNPLAFHNNLVIMEGHWNGCIPYCLQQDAWTELAGCKVGNLLAEQHSTANLPRAA